MVKSIFTYNPTKNNLSKEISIEELQRLANIAAKNEGKEPRIVLEPMYSVLDIKYSTFMKKFSDELIKQLKDQYPQLAQKFRIILSQFISHSYKNSKNSSERETYRSVRAIYLVAFISSTFTASETMNIPFHAVHLNLRDY